MKSCFAANVLIVAWFVTTAINVLITWKDVPSDYKGGTTGLAFGTIVATILSGILLILSWYVVNKLCESDHMTVAWILVALKIAYNLMGMSKYL